MAANLAISTSAETEKIDFDEAVVLLSEKVKRRVLVREMFIYLVFFVVFLAQLFIARDVRNAYEMQSTNMEAIVYEEFPDIPILKTFENVQSEEEFWQWAITVLGPVLDNDDNLIFGTNKIIGAVRFRQLRVNTKKCAIGVKQAAVYPTCYPTWSTDTNSQTSYGPGNRFKYSAESTVQSPPLMGKAMNTLYPGAGFIVDIDVSKDKVNFTKPSEQITQLQTDSYLDRQTRVIVIKLNTYNGNVDIFATTGFMVEFTPGGMVVPLPLVRVYRVNPYTTTNDVTRIILWIIVIILLLYFTVREILNFINAKKIYKTHLKYFTNGWNVLDVVNFTLFWIQIVLEVSTVMGAGGQNISLTGNSTYIHLDWIAENYTLLFNLQAFNVLFTFMKAFKYLQLNDRMNVLWSTLGKASGDLLAFTIFFGIVFFAFGTMGHLVFGPDVEKFRDMGMAFMTCFKMILGEFNEQEISFQHREIGPFFFLFFVILVYFALTNMFLAIINDAYIVVNRELRGTQKLTQQLQKGFKKKWQEMTDTILRRERGRSDEDLLHRLQEAPIGHDSVLTPQELKMALGPDISQMDIERLIYVYQNMRGKVYRHKKPKADAEEIEMKTLIPNLRDIKTIGAYQVQQAQQMALLQQKIDMIMSALGHTSAAVQQPTLQQQQQHPPPAPAPGAGAIPPPFTKR